MLQNIESYSNQFVQGQLFDRQPVKFNQCGSDDQSIDQSINLYRAIVQRRVLQCGYAESKRNVLRRILNVLTDGAV